MQYKDIKPKIIAEELLDEGCVNLQDYKVLMLEDIIITKGMFMS